MSGLGKVVGRDSRNCVRLFIPSLPQQHSLHALFQGGLLFRSVVFADALSLIWFSASTCFSNLQVQY